MNKAEAEKTDEQRINRNILECKYRWTVIEKKGSKSINRNILECKL